MFDKDKNWLVSAEEIQVVVQKYLAYRMTPPEVKQLADYIHKNYKRDELRKAELLQLLKEEKVSNDYNEGQAKKTLRELYEFLVDKDPEAKKLKYAKRADPAFADVIERFFQ